MKKEITGQLYVFNNQFYLRTDEKTYSSIFVDSIDTFLSNKIDDGETFKISARLLEETNCHFWKNKRDIFKSEIVGKLIKVDGDWCLDCGDEDYDDIVCSFIFDLFEKYLPENQCVEIIIERVNYPEFIFEKLGYKKTEDSDEGIQYTKLDDENELERVGMQWKCVVEFYHKNKDMLISQTYKSRDGKEKESDVVINFKLLEAINLQLKKLKWL